MAAWERNTQVPALSLHMFLGPGKDGRGIPRGPLKTRNGDWPLLMPPERVSAVTVVRREHLPKLEKIQEVLASRRDEAHFRSGVSSLIKPNLWNFQRVLHTLAATQEVP